MDIEPQANPELALVAKLIENARVAMLTTLGDDDSLDSRPMVPLKMDAAGVIWFFTDIRSAKLDRLRQVNLAFSDESRASYVSLSGHGEVDTEPQRLRALWTPQVESWFPQGRQSGALALLRFVPHHGEYWDAPQSRMVRLLSSAVSAVAGRPTGAADHGELGDLSVARPQPPSVAML